MQSPLPTPSLLGLLALAGDHVLVGALPCLQAYVANVVCIIGQRVAELEMNILLAQMMRNFRMECHDEKPMERVSKLFLYPARRLDLRLIDLN